MTRRILICALAIACLGSAPRSAWTAAAFSQSTSSAATSSRPDEDARVDVPSPSEQVVRYQRGGAAWWFVAQVWSLAVPAIVLWTGLSAKIQRWVSKPGRTWFFMVGTYSAVYSILEFAANRPLSYYTDLARGRMYGFTHPSSSGWLATTLLILLAIFVVAYFAYWLTYLLIRKSPRRWWLYTSMATLPLLLFQSLVVPRQLKPDPGQFERMADASIERSVLALAARAKVQARVLIDVHSVDSGQLNAYAIGVSDSKPIVFGRTLVTRLDQVELLSIAGHEIGHYALHHIAWRLLVSWLLATLGWYVAYRTMPGIVARYSARFGFERISDIASLPLLLLVTGAVSLATTPIEVAFARHQEHEADRFVLELTHTNHSYATALIKLMQDEDDPVDPRPGWFDQAWRGTHPSFGERIDFCNSYKPWKTGEPSRYAHLIDAPPANQR